MVSLISTIAFAIGVDGDARTLAGVAAAGFGLILVGSGAWLVPLQRRLVAPGSDEAQVDTDTLRRRWFHGLQTRATVALLSFTLSVIALVS